MESGKALAKMNQIIKAQGKHKKISLGKYTHEVKTSKHGTITEIDNEIIAKIARIAGAPEDKGAGLYLHKKVGDKVEVEAPAGKITYNILKIH